MGAKHSSFETRPYVLVVEGVSDAMFYDAILRHLGRSERVNIIPAGGKDEILDSTKLGLLLTRKLIAEKIAIGVIVDANGDPPARLASLLQMMKNVTGRTLQDGVIDTTVSDEARIGCFVVPDGVTWGSAETLAWSTVPEPTRTRVDTFLADMKGLDAKYQPKNLDKARVAALLATLNSDDPRLGPGARAGCFDLASPRFNRLRTFLDAFSS